MRYKGVNANPPICRSKDKTSCEIKWFDCDTHQALGLGVWRGITRAECIAHVMDKGPSYGTRFFSNPIINFSEAVDFNLCVVPVCTPMLFTLGSGLYTAPGTWTGTADLQPSGYYVLEWQVNSDSPFVGCGPMRQMISYAASFDDQNAGPPYSPFSYIGYDNATHATGGTFTNLLAGAGRYFWVRALLPFTIGGVWYPL